MVTNNVSVAELEADKNCSLEDIQSWRDFTTMYGVNENGDEMEVQDDTSGDFRCYYCTNCGTDWSETAVQDQEQAWTLVKEHING